MEEFLQEDNMLKLAFKDSKINEEFLKRNSLKEIRKRAL